MKKLFYTLLMLFLAYLCFYGYRSYKYRIDSMFFKNVSDVNREHYSKLEKILELKNEFNQKVSSLKNDIEKLEKENSQMADENKNDKSDKSEINKNTHDCKGEDCKNENHTTKGNGEKDVDNQKKIDENKKKIIDLKSEIVNYEALVPSLNMLYKELEDIAKSFHTYLKKNQLGFISESVKKETTSFLKNYEEKESDLNKKIEEIVENCKNIKEKLSTKKKSSSDKENKIIDKN